MKRKKLYTEVKKKNTWGKHFTKKIKNLYYFLYYYESHH